KIVRSYTGHVGDLWDVRFTHGGRFIAAAGREGAIYFWDAQTSSLRATVRVKAGSIWSFVPDRDDRSIYVATSENRIRVARLVE
ncbi:unnamed protein product, partial [marine sediment metagenome]